MKKIILFFLSIALFSCNQGSDKPKTKTDGKESTAKKVDPGWKTLEENNYSVHYPAEWELNQKGQFGMLFILLSPPESSDDNFRENVNLVAEDLKGRKIDLDEYAKASEQQVRSIINNVSIKESKHMNNGSTEYHKLVYTGDQGLYSLQFEQHYFIKDNKAFVLTLTCLKDKFDQYKETGEGIMNSFELKN